MSTRAGWPCAAVAVCLTVAGEATAQTAPSAPPSHRSLAYTGALQYASGDFSFARRTWSAYLSNGLTGVLGRVRASATMPVVFQDAGLVQYGGAGMVVPSGGMRGSATSAGSASGPGMSGMHHGMGSQGMTSRHVGIGDPIGRVDVALLPDASAGRALDLVVAAKAPVAGLASGFGTGEWDVGGGLSAAVPLGGTVLLADAVYWKLGNPAGGSLRDALAYAVSVGRVLPGRRWSVLGSVTGASRVWVGLGPPVQAGVGVGRLFESGTSLTLSLAAGLTRAAPSVAAGLGWRVPLGRRP